MGAVSGSDNGPLGAILDILDDHKAENVVKIDLSGKSSFCDAMVIASGRSTRHVAAMAEHLRDGLKISGQAAPTIEGLPAGDWVLIDAGDVIVHLFRPEVRAFYNLEKMWGIDLPADAGLTAEPISAAPTGQH